MKTKKHHHYTLNKLIHRIHIILRHLVIEDGYITGIYRNREIGGGMIVKAIDGFARHHHVYIRGSRVIKEVREITRKIITPLIIIY